MTNPARLTLTVEHQAWPLASTFRIARGAKTHADVVIAIINDGTHAGHGECVPYARYGETIASVIEQIEAAAAGLDATDTFADLRKRVCEAMPAGAARNALDCALWDLEARHAKSSVRDLIARHHADLKLARPPDIAARLQTCLTLSLDTPDAMASAATACAPHHLLKLKLGGTPAEDCARMTAVRTARPDAALVADANEGWRTQDLPQLLCAAADANIALIEQPVPADQDAILRDIQRTVPICADEALPPGGDIAALADRYDAVNIKLDKAGGLSTALRLAALARAQGLRIMVGSMVATSLSMAPAYRLAEAFGADWVDLDSPALLTADRQHPMALSPTGEVSPPCPELWGG